MSDINTHREIVEIKTDVKDIKTTQELELRRNKQQYIEYVDSVIGDSRESALVFLAMNGKNSLKEIAQKTQLKQPNVTRGKRRLEENGLIYLLGGSGNNRIYGKPRWISILHIDDHVKKKFGIENL